jgi:hypothetical protein
VLAQDANLPAITREIVVNSTKFVLHIAKFVEHQYCSRRQNRIELGQAVKGRGVKVAVEVHDDPIFGLEIGDEFRKRLLK